VPEARAPGRICPPDYGLGPSAFLSQAPIDADVLYVVGGLYGNTVALDALLALFDAEPVQRKRLVLNGDFHWFDRDPAQFERIERLTASHLRLRGNVETEIARAGEEAGCGCAYPEEVDDGTVERSNRILATLKRTARGLGLATQLGRLPMVARARVAGCNVAITHGDERSLAGWRLAHDRLAHAWRAGLADALLAIDADVIAGSHTCSPVAGTHRVHGRLLAAINNGAAGMANFAGTRYGVITRISSAGVEPPAGVRRLYGARVASADVAAIALEFDAAAWMDLFERQWPEGSDAYLSYRRRIADGPDATIAAAVSGAFANGFEAVAA